MNDLVEFALCIGIPIIFMLCGALFLEMGGKEYINKAQILYFLRYLGRRYRKYRMTFTDIIQQNKYYLSDHLDSETSDFIALYGGLIAKSKGENATRKKSATMKAITLIDMIISHGNEVCERFLDLLAERDPDIVRGMVNVTKQYNLPPAGTTKSTKQKSPCKMKPNFRFTPFLDRLPVLMKHTHFDPMSAFKSLEKYGLTDQYLADMMEEYTDRDDRWKVLMKYARDRYDPDAIQCFSDIIYHSGAGDLCL